MADNPTNNLVPVPMSHTSAAGTLIGMTARNAACECVLSMTGSGRGIMSGMPFVTGGVLEEWGPPKQAMLTVQREIRDFNGRRDEHDYCVDLAMRTWHNFREPEQLSGVTPGSVGRQQRRFIVWHSVPKG